MDDTEIRVKLMPGTMDIYTVISELNLDSFNDTLEKMTKDYWKPNGSLVMTSTPNGTRFAMCMVKTVSNTYYRRTTMNKEIELIDEMSLMLDVFNSCIMTNTMPAINSPCHLKILELMENANRVPTAGNDNENHLLQTKDDEPENENLKQQLDLALDTISKYKDLVKKYENTVFNSNRMLVHNMELSKKEVLD